jgi:hypothetical protein
MPALLKLPAAWPHPRQRCRPTAVHVGPASVVERGLKLVCALSRARFLSVAISLSRFHLALSTHTHTPRARSLSLSLAARLQRLAAPSRPFPARASALLRLPASLSRPNGIAKPLNAGWLTCGGSRTSLFRGHRARCCALPSQTAL